MRLIYAILIVILFFGCSAKERKNRNVHWDRNNTVEIVNHMSAAFLTASVIKEKCYNSYMLGTVVNNTYDHLDTKKLMQMITLRLTQNGLIFVQNNAEAKFMGKISALYQKNQATKDMFYLFTLSLVDTKTDTVVWIETVPIRKVSIKPLVGW